MSEGRVLLLEDEETMREVLTGILSAEGYAVLPADRGERALELAVQEPFDLLIFDIRMEGLDGLETLARMHERGHDFASLAITGFADDEAPIRALRMGVGEYLRKPFQTAQLLDAVARLLRRHQRQQAERQRLLSLHQTVRWALGASPQGQLAADLAAELHLPLPACIELEIAATLRDRPWTPPDPLEGRILEIANAAALLPESPLPKGEQLRQQGRYDPLLLESLDRLNQPRQGRSLLGMVQILLLRGEREGARQALRTVLTQDPSGPLGVDAWLSLLELTDDPEELQHLLPQALDWARAVGPLSLARTAYVGGLQMVRLGQPTQLLQQARQPLADLGLLEEAAHCQRLTENPHAAPVPQANLLRLRSFGPFRVEWGASVLEDGTPNVRYLLAFLAAQPRPVHEEVLLTAFWPDGPETSRKRLSNTLSALRRAFPVATVQRTRDLYALAPSVELWHDLTELDRAYAAAQWRRVSQLYTAPYLEGCYLDWALLTRERVERQVIHALEQLAASAERPEQALEDSQRLLTFDPYHTGGNLLAMKAWMGGGRPEHAIRHYQRLEGLLRRELDAEPPLELVEAFHRARLALP